MNTTILTWDDITTEVHRQADFYRNMDTITGVHGIPTGGSVVAAMLAPLLGVPIVDEPTHGTQRVLVVDDLIDSGATMSRIPKGIMATALYRKEHSPGPDWPTLIDGWVKFPWEHEQSPEDSVRRLLEYVGEDPHREGLADTPRRYLSALTEATKGHEVDVAELLAVQFGETHDQMVQVSNIEFSSTCEHHLAPFRGTATVGYVPGDAVVGLSKLARLVDAYAHRLQIQERLTDQIANAMWKHLQPQAVGVVITAHHSCMGNRGVRKHEALMTTSAMLGKLREDAAARSEFMALHRG